MFDVREFGAKGDGKNDDTAALQAALDKAAAVQGTVIVPPGVYLSGALKVASRVGLRGAANPAFQAGGGSTIKLNDEKAKGLLDLTGSLGVTIYGLCLHGGELGEEIHGILFDKPDYGEEEDTPRIDSCRVERFSGDGIHFGRIWCFSVRHSHLCWNGGCGIYLRGWDGFVLDNWFTCNRKAGFGAYRENSAITFIGNRVEWNSEEGLVVYGGRSYIVNGNYFDRNGGCGLALLPRDGRRPCCSLAVTGNILNRNGAAGKENADAHVRIEKAQGITFTGNTMKAGKGDRNQGRWAPENALVCRALEDTVIKDNVMFEGALKNLLVDLGEHGANVIIKDNMGRLKEPE